jgi:flagellar protein FliT
MHCYEQIAPLTDQMLTLACAKQWGALPALEAQYSDLVERLKVIEAQEALDESQMARKHRLLSRIISSHDKICSYVVPQLTTLGDVLKSLERQQSLNQAYGQSDNAYP